MPATTRFRAAKKKHIQIATALAERPTVLLLDEPTNHLDVTSIIALEHVLENLDCALLLTSHDEAFLQKLAGKELYIERNEMQGTLMQKER